MRRVIQRGQQLVLVVSILAAAGCDRLFSTARAEGSMGQSGQAAEAKAKNYPVTHTEAEWKKLLTPEAYEVLRQAGTERAFTGKYEAFHGKALFVCAGCGAPLFRSDEKFESGTGWPSFWQPVNPGAIDTITDVSFGMVRSEVRCARCGGHLGHVFDDGPKPTGLRYCINSVSLAVQEPPAK